MKTVEELADILQAEADLADQLLNVIQEKQQALIHFKAHDVARTVQREREILKPIKELESKRLQVIAEIVAGDTTLNRPPQRVSVRDLVKYAHGETAGRLSELAQRIRMVAGRIHQRNQQNRLLLESSVRFVKNTLRIVTDDYSRQLVDEKI